MPSNKVCQDLSFFTKVENCQNTGAGMGANNRTDITDLDLTDMLLAPL